VKQRHRVGLFSIGLDTYWGQFHGLKERLEGYNREIYERLVAMGADVLNLGMIDTAEKAVSAGGCRPGFPACGDVRFVFDGVAGGAAGEGAGDSAEPFAHGGD